MSGMTAIIISCRNEENCIAQYLDYIIGSGYPNDPLKVLVADGMSDDGTRTIIETRSMAT